MERSSRRRELTPDQRKRDDVCHDDCRDRAEVEALHSKQEGASYTSAVLVAVEKAREPSGLPPVMRTRPLESRAAAANSRIVVIVAVRGVKVLALGLYSSAVLRTVPKRSARRNPPAMSTWPLGSKVAVCPPRSAVNVAERAVKVLATGS